MEDRKSILIVEGKNDGAVITELCKMCGISRNFDLEPVNSKHNVKLELKSRLLSTQEYKKIWVIIDADTDFAASWQSILDILIASKKYSGINTKTPLPNDGLIIKPIDPYDITVGIWIMPNNTDVGMLEDFLRSLIDDDNTLYAKAKSAIDCIESERTNHKGIYKEVHKSKATIHTWLAWQDAPGCSLTTAVNKKLFDKDKELCKRFAIWLSALN